MTVGSDGCYQQEIANDRDHQDGKRQKSLNNGDRRIDSFKHIGAIKSTIGDVTDWSSHFSNVVVV